MTEADIMHEAGRYWVARDRTAEGAHCYAVYYNTAAGAIHSIGDSAYPRTADGLSIAVARCNYLARRHAG